MHRRPHLTRPVRVTSATASALVALAAASGLAACTGGSSSSAPAPDATGPACTALVGRLPGSVADQTRVTDPAAGTAAWGSPQIVLRCGLTPSGPTTTPCLDVNGIGWLLDEAGDSFRLTTYGRRPAVEVLVPKSYGQGKANAAMVDLGPAVQPLPVERSCE